MSDRLRLHKLEGEDAFQNWGPRGRGEAHKRLLLLGKLSHRGGSREGSGKTKRPGWMESLKSARRPVSRRPLTCRVRVQDAAEEAQTNVLRGLQLSALQRWVALIPHSQIFSGLPTTTHGAPRDCSGEAPQRCS